MFKKFVYLLVLVLCVGMFTACGCDKDDDENETETGTELGFEDITDVFEGYSRDGDTIKTLYGTVKGKQLGYGSSYFCSRSIKGNAFKVLRSRRNQ